MANPKALNHKKVGRFCFAHNGKEVTSNQTKKGKVVNGKPHTFFS